MEEDDEDTGASRSVTSTARMSTISGLSRYLPESESGLTLYTTRSRDVAVETVGSDVVDLSNMDWVEATSFLENSLIRQAARMRAAWNQ